MLARLYARIVVTCRPNIEASLVSLAEIYKPEFASRIIGNPVHVNNTFIVHFNMRLATFYSVAAVVWATQAVAQGATPDPFEQWQKPEAGHGMSRGVSQRQFLCVH
jgi:hypothetical protein